MRDFKGNIDDWSFHDKRPYCSGVAIHSGDQYIAFVGDSDLQTNCLDNARLISCAPEMVKFIAELMDEQGEDLKEKESWVYYRAKQILDKALGYE